MSRAKVQPSGLHAVLSIDPGSTTGVAAGIFELRSMLKGTLTDGRVSHKTLEVKGDWLSQVAILGNLFMKWMFHANVRRGLPVQNLHLVIEDYTRRPHASSSNLDSVWIAAGLNVAIVELVQPDDDEQPDKVGLRWQQPGDAKGFATNDRLRLWGLWAVGSDHERDANRHLAVRVNRLLSGK